MTRFAARALVSLLFIALPWPPSAAPAAAQAPNPLLQESALPYHLPPFDRLKDADFKPAFEQGMAEQLQEVAAIARNPAPPSFDNTLVALERSGRLLSRVGPIFASLVHANTDPELEALDKEL